MLKILRYMAYFYYCHVTTATTAASPRFSLSCCFLLTLILLFLVAICHAESDEVHVIQIVTSEGVGSPTIKNSDPNHQQFQPSRIFCACDPTTKRTSGNCTQQGICPSVSGCCRVNIWFHSHAKNFSIDVPGCSSFESSSPSVSHDPLGGHQGDAIFLLNCCGLSGCNNWTHDDLHSHIVPELCNYTAHVSDSSNVLLAFKEYCEELKPGPFTPLEFFLLLCIPICISVCAVCVVLIYTRRVSPCSAPAWKQVLVRIFAGPKCWCVRYRNEHRNTPGRNRSRNSDTSVQQPLFEVATYNPVRSDNNSSNISSITDSGFSNGGPLRKKMSESQGSRTTQTSSILNSGVHRSLLTSSFSTTSTGNNLLGAAIAPPKMQQPPVETNCDTIGEVTNSGSGAGVPSLGRRTMAYQIQLHEVIGRGRYGVVHRGEMFCDQVAVKIFQSRDERAWLRERQIYTTHGMQHDHILAFRGADSKDTGLTTELWLVTEFHANGSLFDLLSQRTIGLQLALKLIYTLIAGLSHLHLEISGTPGKPAIAHRDLKSRNVLVKANNTCCLADFGFAVTYSSVSNRLEQSPASFQCCVGTRRYMSNEILDKSLDCDNFTSFTAADLYALGLVIWEILRRTELDPVTAPADDCELPFIEHGIGQDPSQDDMHRVVCVEKKRPTVPKRFRQEDENRASFSSSGDHALTDPKHIASSLGEMVEELWQETPTARPTALQIKKILLRLRV